MTGKARVTIPKAIKAAVWLRDAGRCQICWAKLTAETVDYEHRIPVWMFDNPADANTKENVYLICGLRSGESCHKDKTARDATTRAKVKRIIKKEAGLESRKKGRKLQHRGFDKTRRRRMDGTVERRKP